MMQFKTFIAQDEQGNAAPLPTAYVYQAETTTLITGLKDKGNNPLPNPFKGTPSGQIEFAAPPGDYDLRVVSPGRDVTISVQF